KAFPAILILFCLVLVACVVFLGRRCAEGMKRIEDLETELGEAEIALSKNEKIVELWLTRAEKTAGLLGIGRYEIEEGKLAPMSGPYFEMLEDYLILKNGHLEPPMPLHRCTLKDILDEMTRQRDVYGLRIDEIQLDLETKDNRIDDEIETKRRLLQEKDERIDWLSRNVPLMEKENLALKIKNAELLAENSRQAGRIRELVTKLEGLEKREGKSDG
ncbi:MAG: hypothetical protein ACYTFG_18695, partial [Planctomycetota bacterium]